MSYLFNVGLITPWDTIVLYSMLFFCPLMAQDKLFRKQNAMRNFRIPSTWPAYPIHMTFLFHPPDFKL